MSEATIIDQREWLAALRGREENVAATARDLFAQLGREQLCWKPDPKSWSIVEVFGHLLETGLRYEKKLDPAIERARALAEQRGRPGRFEKGWLGRFFLGMIYSDKRRLKAPPSFAPTRADFDPEMARRFDEYTARLIDQLTKAEGAALAMKFPTPISRFFRLRLGVGLELMVAHQERHLRQVERIRARDGFPPNTNG